MDDPQLVFYVTLVLAFGAGICFVYGVMSAVAGSGAAVRARLHGAGRDDVAPVFGGGPLQVLREHRMSRFEGLNHILKANPLAEAIALELTRARVTLNVGEYLMLRVLCGLSIG